MNDKAALRIGIDGEALRIPLSGVGRYVFELCRELEVLLPAAKFFAYARLPAERLSLPSERWTLRREPHDALRRIPSFVWLRTRGTVMCRKDRLDIFWGGRSLHATRRAAARTLVTVHDLNHKIVPETMARSTRWSHRLWFDADVRSADVVFANSNGTARRIEQMLGRRVDAVIQPGLSPAFRPLAPGAESAADASLAALGIVAPYLLSVATLEPRKNIAALFRAFTTLKLQGALTGFRLVLVGARGWHDPELERELAAAQPLGVCMPGFVPDELMPALYARAELLVCPSIYEGFGMPVLEARACGTRVVVADVPELLEAAGPAATVVAPTVEGVMQGIAVALGRPHMSEIGLRDIHDWRRGAHEVARAMAAP